MKIKRSIALILLFVPTLLTFANSSFSAQEYSIVQLSNNGYDNLYPKISNGQVVWTTDNNKVLLYNGSDVIQLTNTAAIDADPQIDNGKVVWVEKQGNYSDILLYDGITTKQLDNSINRDGHNPQISNGQVVWRGYDGSNDDEIFLYNGKNVIQITNNNYYDTFPQIHNGQVVWHGYDGNDTEIFLYNETGIHQITDNNYTDMSPQINNGQIAWEGWNGLYGKDDEIFFYNGSNTIRLTNNSYYDGIPCIYGGQVVWQGNDGISNKIFFYNGTTTVPLTYYNNNRYPQIHNGQVVCESWDGYDWEICLFDGVNARKITNNNYDDRLPQINNGQIVWEANVGGTWQVFLATPKNSILGNVFVEETGAPLNGVNVYVNEQGDNWQERGSAITADGAYNIIGLSPHLYYLYTRLPGYGTTVKTNVSLSADQAITGQDFYMTNNPGWIYGIVKNSFQEPLQGVRVEVSVRAGDNDFYTGGSAITDASGHYEIRNFGPGNNYNVFVPAVIIGGKDYAKAIVSGIDVTKGNGTETNITLKEAATVSGVLKDFDTGLPVNSAIKISYDNHALSLGESININPADGSFTLTNLPDGIARFTVEPGVDTGYAWSTKYIYLIEGQHMIGLELFVRQGALVSGSLKDAAGTGIPNTGVYASGSEGEQWWGTTDANGNFQLRCASAHTYAIGIDNISGALTGMPQETAISGPLDDKTVQLIGYNTSDASHITGEVTNPNEYEKTSAFGVIAFPTGQAINRDTLRYINPVNNALLNDAAPYDIMLPPGHNYDLLFCVLTRGDMPDSVGRRGSLKSVPAGSTTQNFVYDAIGGTITGIVTHRGEPLLMAKVFLQDQQGNFAGFAQTDQNGEYNLYNIPAGNFFVSAWHPDYGYSGYFPADNLIDGGRLIIDINFYSFPNITAITPSTTAIGDTVTITGTNFGASTTDPKYNPDVDTNHDGKVDLIDLTTIARAWGSHGPDPNFNPAADTNHDNKIDLVDLTIIARAWGSQPGDPNFNPAADTNHDNKIDLQDLTTLARAYGTHGPDPKFNPAADCNHNNVVDLADLTMVARAWGGTRGASFVEFPNSITAKITSWTDTTITCTVPYGTASGEIFVTTSAGKSNGFSITINN